MILNILFFIAWTGLVFFIANRRVRELLDIIHKQEERYNDCIGKLKLRSEQNDMLMQTIKILNDKINNEGDGLNILENFSGLLGKRYLFLQEDNITYYNRYTDEYMTAEDAEHWLYGELSGIINGGE